jgi:hypothetical protein
MSNVLYHHLNDRPRDGAGPRVAIAIGLDFRVLQTAYSPATAEHECVADNSAGGDTSNHVVVPRLSPLLSQLCRRDQRLRF